MPFIIRTKYNHNNHNDYDYKSIKEFIPKICWIFNEKCQYQALISFGSIIKSNVGQKFIFYFILPPKEKIDLTPFNSLLKYGSEIRIRHYESKHAYLSQFSKKKLCKNNGMIIVKIWLKDILYDEDEVLYLDTDVIDSSPISDIWKINLTGKTIGAPIRMHIPSMWINSGVILYNLKNLREKNESLWECANMKNCVVDDAWHSWCHQKDWIEIIPYRFNVEFMAMEKKYKKSSLQLNEEKKACFYHLKDQYHMFYIVDDVKLLKKINAVNENPEIYEKLKKLFEIKKWIDNQIKNINTNLTKKS